MHPAIEYHPVTQRHKQHTHQSASLVSQFAPSYSRLLHYNTGYLNPYPIQAKPNPNSIWSCTAVPDSDSTRDVYLPFWERCDSRVTVTAVG